MLPLPSSHLDRSMLPFGSGSGSGSGLWGAGANTSTTHTRHGAPGHGDAPSPSVSPGRGAGGSTDPDADSGLGSGTGGKRGSGAGTGAGGGAAQRRTSKACENCRVRRTRCTGGLPCEACRSLGLAAGCVVRTKARPNRALPKLLGGRPVGETRAYSSPEGASPRHAGQGDQARNGSISSLGYVPSRSRDEGGIGFSPMTTLARLSDHPPISSSGSLGSTMNRHARFVEDIELSLESWAAARGQHHTLAIPTSSPLQPYIERRPPPPEPDAARERRAIDTYTRTDGQYFDFLPAQRIVDLAARYHHAPASLAEDQRALVRAVVCLGLHRERCWPRDVWLAGKDPVRDEHESIGVGAESGPGAGPGPGDQSGRGNGPRGDASVANSIIGVWDAMGEEAAYYLAALHGLDRWGSASCTALMVLHVLHLFALATGGPHEMSELLGRMAWQVKELGLHRTVTAHAYPPSDRVDRLFFMTVYKDSWYAVLRGTVPHIRHGEYDPACLSPPETLQRSSLSVSAQDMNRGLTAYTFVAQLASFENELATMVGAPVPGAEAEFSVDAVLDLERRWGDWMTVFRDDQVIHERPMLHTFCTIRFHWLRLMLRAPFLTTSHLRLSSLSIIARSAAQILQTYETLLGSPHLMPAYGEARRISTCGYMVCVCFWEREMGRGEAEAMMRIWARLVRRLEEKGCVGVRGKREQMLGICNLLGLDVVEEMTRGQAVLPAVPAEDFETSIGLQTQTQTQTPMTLLSGPGTASSGQPAEWSVERGLGQGPGLGMGMGMGLQTPLSDTRGPGHLGDLGLGFENDGVGSIAVQGVMGQAMPSDFMSMDGQQQQQQQASLDLPYELDWAFPVGFEPMAWTGLRFDYGIGEGEGEGVGEQRDGRAEA